MGGYIGRGDVQHVGRKAGEILAIGAREAERETIFLARRDRHCRHADEIAGRRKRRRLDHGRVDAHRGPLAQQVFDEPVEGLVGAVADVIVVSAEQGDAQIGDVHRGPLGEGSVHGEGRYTERGRKATEPVADVSTYLACNCLPTWRSLSRIKEAAWCPGPGGHRALVG